MKLTEQQQKQAIKLLKPLIAEVMSENKYTLPDNIKDKLRDCLPVLNQIREINSTQLMYNAKTAKTFELFTRKCKAFATDVEQFLKDIEQ